MKTAIVIGAGLGGLSTALRLVQQGYKVTILEKDSLPGGRLNIIRKDGFSFDMGPSFFSMSYEFDELFNSTKIQNPLKFNRLDPLYAVYFPQRKEPYLIYRNLQKLAQEFASIEPDFEKNVVKYLAQAKHIFHSTEHKVVKKNFNNLLHYFLTLTTVPLSNLPLMSRSMWTELNRHFKSEEVKTIFSLVAFFLGATPFDTPAVYSLLNYTELEHDGYWNVKGGMYKITEEMVKLLEERGVEFHYNTEVNAYEKNGVGVKYFVDATGKKWQADKYIVNADAAAFRGKVLGRKKFTEEKLDKMKWTLSPFTIYLGVKGKVEGLHHHNYFLGSNFKQYADTIFKSSVSPEKPYYYVNVSSKSNPNCAPEGCENIFILCPVPDLRFKNDWSDKDALADTIIQDLSGRVGFDIKVNLMSKTIMTPYDWEQKLNLYRGSGLGLAHDMDQVGGFRPKNKDEEFKNLYYVGASTVPGTGLPMVVVSSKLVTERIFKDDGLI